jgi:hypothetical protein
MIEIFLTDVSAKSCIPYRTVRARAARQIAREEILTLLLHIALKQMSKYAWFIAFFSKSMPAFLAAPKR